MVTCSKIFHMIPNIIIIITIFLLLSLQCTHTLATDDASLDAPECLKVHGLQKLHSFEEVSENGDGNQVKKVAGEDENEEKEALIVQKFRALLGLRSSKSRRPSTEYVSPAPSPSPLIEAEPPSSAPAPVLPVHGLHHPPLHHSYRAPQLHKIQKEHTNKSRFRRIIVAVLASIGAAFLVCVVGLFWVTGKFSKSKAKPAKTMSMYKKKGRSRGKSSKHLSSSQKSASKINLNPSLDLLYLSSVGRDLEQQSISLKQAPETANTSSSNHCTPKFALLDREERPNQSELMNKPEESDNASSSTREITSVHEDVESVRIDSDDGGRSSSGDKIIPIECHSSDDESFHSFVDSHSSLVRLSNASAASLNDTSEIPHANVSKGSPSPSSPSKYVGSSQATSSRVSTPELNVHPEFLPSPSNCKEDILAVAYLPNPDTKNVPPPPPPPPALSQSVHCHFPSLHTSSLSSVITSKASDSSTLSTSSSPRKLNSSSGYNQSQQSNLPSSPQKSPEPLSSSPQKSPKVLQGSPSIPPPPCPPPLMKGSSSSVKVPPPPPMGLPQYTPMGKDGAPLAKLKPLHWDKVRAAPDRSMVWDKIRSSSFELDEEMIESLFGYNLRTAVRNDEAKSKTPSPSKHVLEPKRLQNITILSKAINATAEQVCDALIRGDGLGLQQLEALAKMVPTKEEEAKLSGYNGDINELGSAEKFVIVVLRIPFAFLRVEAMLYRETFEDEVVHLRTSFSMLEEACKELRSSRLFLKLLEAVLKTGNRMNVGTIRGGARAFKLDALLKLSDVKGTDGRTTLLHFVVQEIMRSEGIRVSDSIMGKIDQKNRSQTAEEKEEDYKRMGLNLVSGLSTELYNVKKTATIDLDVLASSVSNLSEGMSKLQHLVIKELYADEKSESFVDSMKIFMRYAEKNLKELREDEDRVLLHVREITEYFHGDVSKDEANPLRIFMIVRDFLGMLDHVCKELRNLKVPSSPNPLAPFR